MANIKVPEKLTKRLQDLDLQLNVLSQRRQDTIDTFLLTKEIVAEDIGEFATNDNYKSFDIKYKKDMPKESKAKGEAATEKPASNLSKIVKSKKVNKLSKPERKLSAGKTSFEDSHKETTLDEVLNIGKEQKEKANQLEEVEK